MGGVGGCACAAASAPAHTQRNAHAHTTLPPPPHRPGPGHSAACCVLAAWPAPPFAAAPTYFTVAFAYLIFSYGEAESSLGFYTEATLKAGPILVLLLGQCAIKPRAHPLSCCSARCGNAPGPRAPSPSWAPPAPVPGAGCGVRRPRPRPSCGRACLRPCCAAGLTAPGPCCAPFTLAPGQACCWRTAPRATRL